uniref:ZP domain-containing protein n=1 Tax=Panagrolaimus sp. ES5 TaxID=591445 RepID=A0AC34FNE6_9BILA
MPLENATTKAATGLYDNNGFCGLKYNPEKGEHSLTLVISPDPIVLTDETFALNVKCVHSTKDLLLTLAAPSMDPIKITNIESLTVFGSGGNSPQLDMQIIEGHGLFGKFTKEAKVGQRLTIDITLKDTSIYDLFVHTCFAHDGSYAQDASINITDSNGCAVSLPRAIDAPVFVSAPQKNSTKHVYVYIYGFQFTSSEYVNFECKVDTCVYECSKKQCNDNNLPTSSSQMNLLHKGEETASTKIQTILKILPRKSASKRHTKKDAENTNLREFEAKPVQS